MFGAGYGVAWFIGSATQGLLYDRSLIAVAAFCAACQIAALPILWRVARTGRDRTSHSASAPS